MRDLEDKVAVITGGASGIGFAMACRFARERMKLILADVEQDALRDAAVKLREGGAEVLEVVTDVSDPVQVERLAEEAFSAFGAVHVLCNNAGVIGGGGRPWEIPLETWEWVLGINFWGVLHGVRAFLGRLLDQGDGHIVNTASVAGLMAGGAAGPYSVSKHAVVALSESLYYSLLDMGAAVHISVLCPGYVRTRLADAERNAPPGVPLGSTSGPDKARTADAMRQVLAGGMEPARVAARVHEAILDERFYVLTHDDEEWLLPIRNRMENILAQQNPQRVSSDRGVEEEH